MVRVLRRLGVEADFPADQTCCGQPFFNAGYRDEARCLAKRFIQIFESSECVVAPLGSCTAMTRVFYGDLFQDHAKLSAQARMMAGKIYEFSEFVVNVLHCEDVGAAYCGRVTYHDNCHLLRELRVRDEPRRLIRHVRGVEFVELEEADTCCGFGGIFSVKFPEISSAILKEKIECIQRSGAQVVVANDTGCLMQIAGVLRRRQVPVRVMHLAELLAQT